VVADVYHVTLEAQQTADVNRIPADSTSNIVTVLMRCYAFEVLVECQ
jgi:hypothetical protein